MRKEREDSPGRSALQADMERLMPKNDRPADGDLGTGTPANVDIHKLGQDDKPQSDWGEAAEGATFSSNHSRRAERSDIERGQGSRTRLANKAQVSRRT
jgi:hypothetical protein